MGRNGTKLLKKILIAAAIVLVVVFAAAVGVTGYVYESIFSERFGTYHWDTSVTAGYEGLQMEECYFTSNKGQTLAGAKYSKAMDAPKGVIVLSHGYGGGGHTGYLDYIDYFTSHGYLVFSYDATGNDKSEGDAVGGLPQGVIDLDYALDYVQTLPEYESLPVMLFGHSWGAYSAGTVLNEHPEVRAVVMNAGFNSSADMIRQEGRSYVGDAIDIMLPFTTIYEYIKYGKYAGYSALSGFDNSEAGVFILHGGLDRTVLAENGYDQFYEAYADSDRFTFVWSEAGGHSNMCTIGGKLNESVMSQIMNFYDSYSGK